MGSVVQIKINVKTTKENVQLYQLKSNTLFEYKLNGKINFLIKDDMQDTSNRIPCININEGEIWYLHKDTFVKPRDDSNFVLELREEN